MATVLSPSKPRNFEVEELPIDKNLPPEGFVLETLSNNNPIPSPPEGFVLEEQGFDPEGSGYDYETADKYGIKPDKTGHMPSRVPETGQILKGVQHPTFYKTLEADEKLGYQITKGEDGRYYSQPKKSLGEIASEQLRPDFTKNLPLGNMKTPTMMANVALNALGLGTNMIGAALPLSNISPNQTDTYLQKLEREKPVGESIPNVSGASMGLVNTFLGGGLKHKVPMEKDIQVRPEEVARTYANFAVDPIMLLPPVFRAVKLLRNAKKVVTSEAVLAELGAEFSKVTKTQVDDALSTLGKMSEKELEKLNIALPEKKVTLSEKGLKEILNKQKVTSERAVKAKELRTERKLAGQKKEVIKKLVGEKRKSIGDAIKAKQERIKKFEEKKIDLEKRNIKTGEEGVPLTKEMIEKSGVEKPADVKLFEKKFKSNEKKEPIGIGKKIQEKKSASITKEMVDETLEKSTISLEEAIKEISNKLGKDIGETLAGEKGVLPMGLNIKPTIKNTREFLKKHKIQLTDDEIDALNKFVSGLIKKGIPAEERAKRIHRYMSLKTNPIPVVADIDDDVVMITKLLTKRKKQGKGDVGLLQDVLFTEERARRFGKSSKIAKETSGKEGFFAETSALKGRMPRVQFKEIESTLGTERVKRLMEKIKTAWEKEHIISYPESLTARRGFIKLIQGEIPPPSEIAELAKVFPEDFIKALQSNRSTMKKIGEGVLNILNLPRAVMATGDLSAPLRQGMFLIRRQKMFAPTFRDMHKYAFSEKAYKGLLKDIKARPNYQMAKEAKVAYTDLGADLTLREEQFMSNLAEKTPVLGHVAKGSNRAYSGFLNQLRADLFDDMIRIANKKGVPLTQKELKAIGGYVNAATGRGNLGKFGESIAPLLNAVGFSPRLVSSRLLLPTKLFSRSSVVRMEALKDWSGFIGVGTSILTAAKMSGADVGLDPRSADFGKIKIGDTRYDVWGGFQQYVRLIASIFSGTTVSSTTGREYKLGEEGYKPTTRTDILGRAVEFKLSPTTSFVWSAVRGTDAMGKKFEVTPQIVDRMYPMIAQDMYDMYKGGELQDLPMISAIYGVGVQKYGQQIPVRGKTASGKPNVQFRPDATLGEKAIEWVIGEKITDIPESQHRKLLKEREENRQKRWNTIDAKKEVMETGKPKIVNGNTYIYKENGIVKTKKIKERTRITRRTR